MKKSEAIEVEIEDARELFQDFLTEIPEEFLISRAKEIEKKLGTDRQTDPDYTEAQLNEKYLQLIQRRKA